MYTIQWIVIYLVDRVIPLEQPGLVTLNMKSFWSPLVYQTSIKYSYPHGGCSRGGGCWGGGKLEIPKL